MELYDICTCNRIYIYTYNYSRFRVCVTYIIYTLSECLALCCKAAVLKEGGKKIKPQDMLEDIPDEIIDMDISGLKGILTLEAWEQQKDTSKNFVYI